MTTPNQRADNTQVTKDGQSRRYPRLSPLVSGATVGLASQLERGAKQRIKYKK